MRLSVVIPVYNVETYLNKCVDSVINQKIKDIEIILVDDGSSDNSPTICDEYSSNYSYIKTIHKTNGGLSSARNVGFKESTGEYVIFLDSDDWWNENVDMNKIMSIVCSNPNVEMFLLTSLDFVEGKGFYKRKEHNNLSKIDTSSIETYYRDLLNNGNLEVHAATKILKSSFLKNNNLYFQSGIKSEDNEWMLRLLRCLKNVKIIDEPFYIYRCGRSGSITNTIGKQNILDLINIVKSSISFYEDNTQLSFEFEKNELCYCAYLWFSALGLSYRVNKQERKSLKKCFKETSCVCKFSNSPKTKLAYMLFRCFGYNITSVVLGEYIKLRRKQKINENRVK